MIAVIGTVAAICIIFLPKAGKNSIAVTDGALAENRTDGSYSALPDNALIADGYAVNSRVKHM